MNNQKPKDCICGFPVLSATKHQEYCPAHKRITDKRFKKEQERSELEYMYAKDAYGRWVAGVGPKPDE